jgi:hypothetical protein
MEGCHDAAVAEVLDADEYLAYSQTRARPTALGQTVDPADNDIGSQPAIVVTEGRDRAIRSHQQRQDVEAFRTLVANQPGALSSDVLDLGVNLRTLPGATVHSDGAFGIRHRFVAEKARMRAGRDHSAARVLDMYKAIPGDAERS